MSPLQPAGATRTGVRMQRRMILECRGAAPVSRRTHSQRASGQRWSGASTPRPLPPPRESVLCFYVISSCVIFWYLISRGLYCACECSCYLNPPSCDHAAAAAASCVVPCQCTFCQSRFPEKPACHAVMHVSATFRGSQPQARHLSAHSLAAQAVMGPKRGGACSPNVCCGGQLVSEGRDSAALLSTSPGQ